MYTIEVCWKSSPESETYDMSLHVYVSAVPSIGEALYFNDTAFRIIDVVHTPRHEHTPSSVTVYVEYV